MLLGRRNQIWGHKGNTSASEGGFRRNKWEESLERKKRQWVPDGKRKGICFRGGVENFKFLVEPPKGEGGGSSNCRIHHHGRRRRRGGVIEHFSSKGKMKPREGNEKRGVLRRGPRPRKTRYMKGGGEKERNAELQLFEDTGKEGRKTEGGRDSQ